MRQFRYQMVTAEAGRFGEMVNERGREGWRLVTATPAGGVWSGLLEQEVEGRDRRVTASRVRVEFRSAGVVTEDVVEADGLSVLDGVVYLRRADEVLATYTVDDVISMDWSPGSAYAQALERKRRDHPRHGDAWSAEEDGQLRQEHEAGWTVRAMVDSHQRGRGAIESRLVKLGLEGPEPSSPTSS